MRAQLAAPRSPSHVGEHQILQADPFHGPSRIEDWSFGAHEKCALPVGMRGFDDLLARGQTGWVPAGSNEATSPANLTREATSTTR